MSKARVVAEIGDTAQPTLVSGTNIKTINGTSLLGSGNLSITSGVSSVEGQTGAVDLKTVGGQSLIGPGDISLGVNGTANRYSYVASAGQTTFAATYNVGFVDVYLNGIKLVAGTDFTASSGTSIVLSAGAALNNTVDIIGYGTFEVANTYTQAQTDTLLAAKQATLVSGTSIKTVNSTSLLGSGDVAVQATLVSGTNIKTVNGSSILGSGNLTVGGIPDLTRSTRTSNTILAAGDKGTLIDVTSGTFTQTLTAAATLGAGWWCYLANTGTGTVTVDPNASELIGGVATATLRTGDVWLITCTGTAFDLKRLAGNTVVVLTSGTSYTVEAGVYRLDAELWGGGGSGAADASNTNRSSGGGGGGYCRAILRVTPGEAISYGVGAGGSAPSWATGNNGNSGGSTTFKTLTANGGSAGLTSTSTTAKASNGGDASGGDVNITGGAGWGTAVTGMQQGLSHGGYSPNGGSGGVFVVAETHIFPSIPGGGSAATTAYNPGPPPVPQAGARGEIRISFI